MVRLESAELSDIGRKRTSNEDACLRLPGHGVFCIADGMGGVVGGDLASEAITTRLQEVFTKASSTELGHLSGRIELFKKAVNQASKWIKTFADEKAIRQMGSTVVALIFDPRNPSQAVGLHAGDSRLYRYREGELTLLTSDHTAMAALAAKLRCDPASLPTKYQNELVRAVGLSETVDLEETPVAVRSGDLFLLCSDGLTRMLPDMAIATVLREHTREVLDGPVKALVNAANAAGGKDNITIILVKADDPEGLSATLKADEATTTAPTDSLATESPLSADVFGQKPEPRGTPEACQDDTLQTEVESPEAPQAGPAGGPAIEPVSPPSPQPQGRTKTRKIAVALLPALILLSGAIWFQAGRRTGFEAKVRQTNGSVTVVKGRTTEQAFALTETARTKRETGARRTWTNVLGMAFVEVPGNRFWVGTARITPLQYEQITGAPPGSGFLEENDGLPLAASVTYAEAREFVEKLNRRLRTDGALPTGYKTGRFALPTTNQWAAAADASAALDLRIKTPTHYAEWCAGESDQGTTASFFAEFNQPRFRSPLESREDRVAFRLVLIP